MNEDFFFTLCLTQDLTQLGTQWMFNKHLAIQVTDWTPTFKEWMAVTGHGLPSLSEISLKNETICRSTYLFWHDLNGSVEVIDNIEAKLVPTGFVFPACFVNAFHGKWTPHSFYSKTYLENGLRDLAPVMRLAGPLSRNWEIKIHDTWQSVFLCQNSLQKKPHHTKNMISLHTLSLSYPWVGIGIWGGHDRYAQESHSRPGRQSRCLPTQCDFTGTVEQPSSLVPSPPFVRPNMPPQEQQWLNFEMHVSILEEIAPGEMTVRSLKGFCERGGGGGTYW